MQNFNHPFPNPTLTFLDLDLVKWMHMNWFWYCTMNRIGIWEMPKAITWHPMYHMRGEAWTFFFLNTRSKLNSDGRIKWPNRPHNQFHLTWGKSKKPWFKKKKQIKKKVKKKKPCSLFVQAEKTNFKGKTSYTHIYLFKSFFSCSSFNKCSCQQGKRQRIFCKFVFWNDRNVVVMMKIGFQSRP